MMFSYVGDLRLAISGQDKLFLGCCQVFS